MKHTAKLKLNLMEVKLIRTMLEFEINKNELKIESLNIVQYNELLEKLLKKIQRGEINILEDVLENQ